MATFLELVNEVLVLMREDEVTTYNESDYSTLIAKFVNRAKKRVENAWEWSRLRNTIQVTTASGTFAYTLTGAGKRFRVLKKKKSNRYDVLNDTDDTYLIKAPPSKMNYWLNLNDVQTEQPIWWDFNGFDASGDPIVNFYPKPDGVYTINFNMWIPQADLAADATEMTIPEEPVIELAYLYAIRERGEDMGNLYQEQKDVYKEVLADAIAQDILLNHEDMYWETE